MIFGLLSYLFSSTLSLTSLSIIFAIAIVIIGSYNYEGNFRADFYEDYMTVEYRFGNRFKTISYRAIEKAEFVTTGKSPTRLVVVYLDGRYGRHDIQIIGQDKEFIKFVETTLKPIVRTNNFTWTPKDDNNAL